MAEPPAKRVRRTDSAAVWDRDARKSPKSPMPHESRRDDRGREIHGDARSTTTKRNDEKRRSRSPRDKVKRERNHSRSRDRSHREKERDRDRYRERDQDRHDRNDRDRYRDHERDRNIKVKAERQRSRSPIRNGTGRLAATSPLRGSQTGHERQGGHEVKGAVNSEPTERPNINGDSKMEVDEDDEVARIRRVMGFSSFKSTHNMKVPGNQIYGVRKEKKTVYRQYMNRVGGFNRPLSPGR